MQYRIKEIRKKKRMTQKELSELAGISRTTISKLENGEECEIMVGTLNAIANALKVSVRSLFY